MSKRTLAVRNMPVPQNVSQLRSFLGAINFYGRYIKEMRPLRAPLDKLLQKDVTYVRSKECQESFDKAKDIICSDLLLVHYDPGLPIIVAADASKDGIRATIGHKFPDGSIKIVDHASKAFNSAQQNFSQIEKEGLTLIFAVKKFRKYTFGQKFTLHTDHKPLLSVFGSTNGIPVYAASLLQRWALILSAYNFNITHIRTNDFGQVDSLSRLIADYPREDKEQVIAMLNLVDPGVENMLTISIEMIPVTSDEIATLS